MGEKNKTQFQIKQCENLNTSLVHIIPHLTEPDKDLKCIKVIRSKFLATSL